MILNLPTGYLEHINNFQKNIGKYLNLFIDDIIYHLWNSPAKGEDK